MFGLSDDDDNFWDDVPLGDITNLKPVESVAEDSASGTRNPTNGNSNLGRSSVTSCVPSVITEAKGAAEQTPPCTRTVTGLHNDRPVSCPTTVPSERQTAAPIRESFTTPVGTRGRAMPGSTPRRPKRKFPGPAGLLPKLQPGQSMDSVTVPGICQDLDKSNKDDTVIMSSQSSDDVFLDTPWQTLLSDLGEEDSELLKKFSIASISLKASKKQLLKGKVAMVFAVIEGLDTHGSDASVTLRDKSGRIQGTVHRDLLKDYEAELQPGTVIVLRQVSVISLTNKNHYLNITPSNIVVLYQNKNSQLQRVKFHGSQDSLHSILVSLERKANQELMSDSSGHGTPGSVNSSRLSNTGRNSAASTPVLFNAMLNETMTNLRNQGSGSAPFTPRTPGVRDVRFTPSVPGVRDVRFTPSGMKMQNLGVRPNIHQTPVNVRTANPQTPDTNSRGNANASFHNTFVPNTKSVRLGFTPGQGITPKAVQQNTPLAASSYRFKPNPRGQTNPVSNVTIANMSGQSSRPAFVQSTGIAPVPNTSNSCNNGISAQRITQLSNRSSLSSSTNGKSKTSPPTETHSSQVPQTMNTKRSFGITPLTTSKTAELLPGSDVLSSSYASNSVMLTPSNSIERISPESNGKKRKWSFKSPTSPDLGSTLSNISGIQTNSSLQFSVNVRKNDSAPISSLKRPNIGQSLDSVVSSEPDRRTVGSAGNGVKRSLTNLHKPSTANALSSVEDFNNNHGMYGNGTKSAQSCDNTDSLQVNNQTVSKSKWSFKSKTTGSPYVPEKSSQVIGQNGSCDTISANQKIEDLWQDDLSDELLSQLSEEMM